MCTQDFTGSIIWHRARQIVIKNEREVLDVRQEMQNALTISLIEETKIQVCPARYQHLDLCTKRQPGTDCVISTCGLVAERKLAEMGDAMEVVDAEIAGLDEQQAELLRQLKLVQHQISAAKAKKVPALVNTAVITVSTETLTTIVLSKVTVVLIKGSVGNNNRTEQQEWPPSMSARDGSTFLPGWLVLHCCETSNLLAGWMHALNLGTTNNSHHHYPHDIIFMVSIDHFHIHSKSSGQK